MSSIPSGEGGVCFEPCEYGQVPSLGLPTLAYASQQGQDVSWVPILCFDLGVDVALQLQSRDSGGLNVTTNTPTTEPGVQLYP